MTQFIDVPTLAKIISAAGIESFLTELTAVMEEDFRRWPAFEKSARLASHSDVGVIELMPVTDGRLYSFKYVNGHPSNTRRGLPTVMAFGALAEVATGYPLLLSELTLCTALRTAAASVMTARVAARNDAAIMAMIGCGAQAEFQAIAFHHLLGIEELRIYDIDAGMMHKLSDNLRAFPRLGVTPAASVAEAVKGADIVTTVTADKQRAAILTPAMVEPGMHINGLGGDCPGKTEIHPQVLEQSKIFVEYEPQTRVEGEIQQLSADYPVTEIWQVVSGRQPGRDHRDQITLFDSVGFALEDFSILRYLYETATEMGIADRIALIPEPTDPRNLYSVIAPVTPPAAPYRVA